MTDLTNKQFTLIESEFISETRCLVVRMNYELRIWALVVTTGMSRNGMFASEETVEPTVRVLPKLNRCHSRKFGKQLSICDWVCWRRTASDRNCGPRIGYHLGTTLRVEKRSFWTSWLRERMEGVCRCSPEEDEMNPEVVWVVCRRSDDRFGRMSSLGGE